MGYKISLDDMNIAFKELSKDYMIFAPKLFKDEARFSDTDRVRYAEVEKIEDIVFDQKSDYSFKEALTPISETLFYYTEDEVKEADKPEGRSNRGAIIFLRSCDLHSLKRLDDIYLNNKYEDYYYKRLRENTKFILIGCENSFENCFCVSMGTNKIDSYDSYIKVQEDGVYIDNKCEELDKIFTKRDFEAVEVLPDYVVENAIKVNIPENLSLDVMDSDMWKEYDERCIACGRCNFVCPTCTCFTMQDIFYTDNGKVGERRRVWASCHVDGYTDMAGGHSYRKNNGQRMRFKTMHKVYDYKKRFGDHMCTGCGRCDDICPEYISFSNCINKLEDAMKEVK